MYQEIINENGYEFILYVDEDGTQYSIPKDTQNPMYQQYLLSLD